MNIHCKFYWCAFLIIMMVWIGGCSDEGGNGGMPTGTDRVTVYERSPLPGLAVLINLNSRHIQGQPYGAWMVNASWRDTNDSVITALDIPVVINQDGIGTLFLPKNFLNYVFQEAHNRFIASGDTKIWTHQPGLYLFFYADSETYSYFDGFNVVGGGPASYSDWPWITALIEQGKTPATGQFCGGSLIHPEWVLTAAHCLEGNPAVDVMLGSDDLSAPPESYDRIPVIKKILHPRYDPNAINNDIALMRLARPAGYPTISWDQTGRAQSGTLGWVAGWGATDFYAEEFPVNLMEVDLPVIENAVCNQTYQNLFGLSSNTEVITGNMFCAGPAEGGKDSCSGDSGGPFIINNTVTGLVSWGPDLCAQANSYGVYTRVSNYAAWINSIIQTDVSTDFTNGWYYGGSLEDLVTQLGLNWHPSAAPIQDLGVTMYIGFVQ